MIARFDGQDAQAWDDVSLTHQFSRDGFLVFENYCGSDVCDALIVAANSLVAEVAQADDPAVFSTLSHAHASQSYFLDSGANVHFFFEEEAFDESGRLVAPVAHAINKIGHGLHDEVGVFDRFSRDSRLATLCATLGINTPRLVQSMYIFKQPRIGGEVVWHQDSTFLYTEPMSVIGLWVALEPATRENGCLWVLPGAHQQGLKQRWVRDDDALSFTTLDDTPWNTDERVPLEVDAGTLVVLHGELPHWSAPNRTAQSRHAYALHVIDGDARYSARNWLQRPREAPLRGFERGR